VEAREAGDRPLYQARDLEDETPAPAPILYDPAVARGAISVEEAGRRLADRTGLPWVRLAREAVDRKILGRVDGALACREGWFPVRREGGSLLVAVVVEPDAELRARIAAQVGDEPVTFCVTDTRDLVDAVLRHSGRDLAERAAHTLERERPELSASRTFTRPQVVILVVAVLIGLACLIRWPLQTYLVLIGATGVGYAANVVFRFVVSLEGARFERLEAITDRDLAMAQDRDLPTYTILVPIFRESRVIEQLVRNLNALDYPPEKVEILLLLEAGDEETIEAARAADLSPMTRLVVVPEVSPQTKPKACDVGLALARGELIVIFDAEDQPEPDQLRKTALLFERNPRRLVCVQAELNYWNANENLLTRMFAVEYSYLFDYLLPGLSHFRLPIPLGGTSNHFRTSTLRALGGWDPHNVTEDADLGIRAAALGFQVRTVNSTTWEEATSRVHPWIKQRSRWIKGYMQTTLVHLRHPLRLLRGAGPLQAMGFALLVGGTPVTFLIAPVMWILFLVLVVIRLTGTTTPLLPPWLQVLTVLELVLGNGLMIYLSMLGGFRRRRYGLVPWALCNPIYWLLHSIASYKALWQLLVRPHYWEKTEHGITSQAASDA
jgi:cellulose synthase/poly-beta-1,6-N-acetylglucosamine synthase-like glycosyltransferase